MPQANIILLNGRILTMSRRAASALAILRERVVAVGEDDDILALRGPRTRVYDLDGRLALPGLRTATSTSPAWRVGSRRLT